LSAFFFDSRRTPDSDQCKPSCLAFAALLQSRPFSERPRMVRSRLASVKHLLIALAALGLCVCTTELALPLAGRMACSAAAATPGLRAPPSWTVHHLFKPDVHIVTSDPDTQAEVEWRTNSHGLRRRGNRSSPSRLELSGLSGLGDDSTLAPETPTAATFSANGCKERCSRRARLKIEVINAGCPQYGPLLSYLPVEAIRCCRSRPTWLSAISTWRISRTTITVAATCAWTVCSPCICPHPDLEWQRSAAERIWVQRLLMWRHGQRGLGYVLGKEDQPEDVRDIDSLKGTYAWLRDDAP